MFVKLEGLYESKDTFRISHPRTYISIDISQVRQFYLETVSSRMGIACEFIPFDSTRIDQTIFIDERLTKQEQGQSFAHEVAHIRYHIGNQLILPISLSQWQEWCAHSFMLEFCVPRFMLEKCIQEHPDMHPIEMIVKKLNFTYEFALQRFRRYQMNLYQHTPLL
ncbi:ImmA/IrrE family metallo-endopeptidase [Paenisporosarcina sp. FSL H8-0542]|uniref:ImmA/IrrE family metallo-endopeptidase n=1 Tax=Paenisporosarcina sp. FSL H8-0542 TaxID=2921401 RepID=UPI00315AC875